MNQSRWQKVEEIYHSALEVAEEIRSDFVEKICADDYELRCEVESLLAEAEQEDSFLSSSMVSVGLALINQQQEILESGQQIGRYKIKKLLARGGMGDVYLAEDTSLRRLVALKKLSVGLFEDTQSLQRFHQESRALSAISHPNVAHIYEFGESAHLHYLIMEYVDGKSLRSLIKQKKIGIQTAVEIALQIAGALAAAHGKGIIHRDIKPENIMLGGDGFVKVLDFGLAKLNEKNDLMQAKGGDFETMPGLIMGTVKYMSPEQVRGEEADERTDIWSLGVVLYEMVFGERPFAGDSNVETLSAILKEEPTHLDNSQLNVHPLLADILRRCLAKDCTERFQSADDLAFVLNSFGKTFQSGFTYNFPTNQEKNSNRRWIWRLTFSLILLTLVFAGVLIYRKANFSFQSSAPLYRQITYQRGTVWSARFFSSGSSILYSATWNGNASNLFIVVPPNSESRNLGLPNTTLLAVSSKNEMAVLFNKHYLYQFIHRGTLARLPIEGSAPREIAENVQEADWSPDGENLAIVRWIDGRNRLEYPIGKVLYETNGYISCPRISPTGDRIAFLDHQTQWDNRGYVSVVDLSGNKQILSGEWSGEEGLTWTPSGEEVWVTASKSGEAYSLYAVSLSGKERLVAVVPINLMLFDISADGRILLSRAVQRTDIYGNSPGAPKEEQNLSWLQLVGISDFSADGNTFLFTHFGEGSGKNYSVYLRRTDGSSAIRLGEGRALALSPDGRFALAKLNSPEKFVLLPTKTGDVKPLSPGTVEHLGDASWFPDNQNILFIGNETGRGKRCFRQNLASGEIQPVTPEGIIGTKLSPDGRTLIATDINNQKILYLLESGETSPINGLDDDDEIIRWNDDGKSLFVFHPLDLPIKIYRLNLAAGNKELVREIKPSDQVGTFGAIYCFLTPNAKTYIYGLRKYLFDLYIAEGLK